LPAASAVIPGSGSGTLCAPRRYQTAADVHRLPAFLFSGDFSMSTILIVILILILLGALPTWPYSRGWGYYPGGLLGLVLIIVIILALMGRI
jgi:hypothetical protein